MLEDLPYLSFFPFFTISLECSYLPSVKKWSKEHLIPSTSSYLEEKPFADLLFGWRENALFFRLDAEKPFEYVETSDYQKGDALEIFINTRDLAGKRFSSFCHQFIFFPEKVGGHLGKEITPFRSAETHPLADPRALGVESTLATSSYSLQIEIPSLCLYGFDPNRFDHFGFAYRIHRPSGVSQNSCLSPFEFSLEQQPSFWSRVQMIKK